MSPSLSSRSAVHSSMITEVRHPSIFGSIAGLATRRRIPPGCGMGAGASEQRTAPWAPRWRYVLFFVWLISAAYGAAYIDRGWIPHDEGTLGQSAERVLSGELPHRDFDEVYTGALSFLHAALFGAFGFNLLAPRVLLFLFFLAWIPAVYYLASHFAAPAGAGLLVLLAVAWSVPNYVAALPSWYNLFFATFGTAALFRYLQANQTRWLLVAGLCGGFSLLMKIVGLYYIAATLVFFVFREQCLASAQQTPAAHRTLPYTSLLVAGSLLFLGLLLGVLSSRLGAREFVHFVLPPVAVLGTLLWNERSARASGTQWRLVTLLRLVVPFLLGVAIPTALFLVPYIVGDALSDLLRGVFLTPSKRLSFTVVRPPDLVYSALATAPLLIFLGHRRWHRRPSPLETAMILLSLGAVLIAAWEDWRAYLLIWYSVRMLGPVSVVAGALLLVRRDTGTHLTAERKQQIFLLLCMTAMFSLIQYPFTSPWYFWYVAPLIVLTTAAVLSSWRKEFHFAPVTAAGFYLLCAVLVINAGSRFTVGQRYLPETHTEVLRLDRAGGIRASHVEREQYEQLVAVLKARSGGEYIYATPDCPEVYFLSGLKNPTRTLFDFFDDPAGRTDRILSALERYGVNVVAINELPSFSGAIEPDLAAALAGRFPHTTGIGKFTVRWR